MGLCKNHDHLYFDSLCRTKKQESVLSLINATYQTKINKGTREDIARLLKSAYELFKFDAGTYGGDKSAFDSQYTIGHEVGVWKNTSLDLSDLALKVAENKITIKEYFDIVFLNYIQPIDNKTYNLLFLVTSYMEEKNLNQISKQDLNDIFLFASNSNKNNINGFFNMLLCTSYFTKKDQNTLKVEYEVSKIKECCNLTYHKKDYDNVKNNLSQMDDFLTYLHEDHRCLEIINGIKVYNESNIDLPLTSYSSDLEYIDDYSNEKLAEILIRYYEKFSSVGIHLFAIDYCQIINNFDKKEILKLANQPNSYRSEIDKGIKIGIELKKSSVNNLKSSCKNEQTEWIIPANENKYDHIKSMNKNGFIDWKQTSNYKVGDIVFLYATAPVQNLIMKTVVEEINISSQDKIDDSEFWKEAPSLLESDKFVKLRRVYDIDNELLGLKYLLENGLNGVPQKSIKVVEELSKYIKSILEVGYNKIFYGIPGCGKSYKIEHEVLENVDKEHDVFRTTFFLDYSNSDFVGQIYPSVEKEESGKEKVTYKRIPGPFTKALARAYSASQNDEDKMIYLVIEEINRGNAAAIFGDLFQLLDRLDVSYDGRIPGDSEYPISNEFIEGYLSEKEITFTPGKIYIPHNLTILATMNTSDQNVFPLDTAFKRRWERERVVTDWETVDVNFKGLYVPYTGKTWEEFATLVNNKMKTQNNDGIILEDKQLGPYFVPKSMLVEESKKDYDTIENRKKLQKFVNNVIDYLYSDVTKFEHEILFKKDKVSYDDIYDAILKYNEKDEFDGDKELCLNVFESSNPQGNTPGDDSSGTTN